MSKKRASPDQNATTATKPVSTRARTASFKAPASSKKPPAAAKTTPPKKAAKPLTPFQKWSSGVGALDQFLAFILEGGHMADFCRQNEFAYTTMLDWVNADSSRAEMYARAREDRADKLADEIVSISDECEYQPVTDMSGNTVALVFDKTAVARNKLRVDARKWSASKLKPRVYGDKVQVEGTVDHKVMSDDALLQRLAKLGVSVASIVPVGPTEGGDAG
ncbi:hypothetical protein N5D77_22020 [Comamonas thiooxydans]|uniref:Terminase small subunit n=1 Tax=Comamonas thiooxydans TaxID=363952 RepID=A0AA42TW53_9BURK|nr:hypothetical protein [Comamonas thiooxydans]MDH1336795.1 hypothetical protein [Comamonas thiooxydans]MDH1742941.1 hypothetical protein [Comamonas thiooxydans]MDH1789259.1 hypothetical protein [Comamonas thiooxydans]